MASRPGTAAREKARQYWVFCKAAAVTFSGGLKPVPALCQAGAAGCAAPAWRRCFKLKRLCVIGFGEAGEAP